MSVLTNSLAQYISNARRRGFGDVAIEEAIKRAGHNDSDISEAFRLVSESTSRRALGEAAKSDPTSPTAGMGNLPINRELLVLQQYNSLKERLANATTKEEKARIQRYINDLKEANPGVNFESEEEAPTNVAPPGQPRNWSAMLPLMQESARAILSGELEEEAPEAASLREHQNELQQLYAEQRGDLAQAETIAARDERVQAAQDIALAQQAQSARMRQELGGAAGAGAAALAGAQAGYQAGEQMAPQAVREARGLRYQYEQLVPERRLAAAQTQAGASLMDRQRIAMQRQYDDMLRRNRRARMMQLQAMTANAQQNTNERWAATQRRPQDAVQQTSQELAAAGLPNQNLGFPKTTGTGGGGGGGFQGTTGREQGTKPGQGQGDASGDGTAIGTMYGGNNFSPVDPGWAAAMAASIVPTGQPPTGQQPTGQQPVGQVDIDDINNQIRDLRNNLTSLNNQGRSAYNRLRVGLEDLRGVLAQGQDDSNIRTLDTEMQRIGGELSTIIGTIDNVVAGLGTLGNRLDQGEIDLAGVTRELYNLKNQGDDVSTQAQGTQDDAETIIRTVYNVINQIEQQQPGHVPTTELPQQPGHVPTVPEPVDVSGVVPLRPSEPIRLQHPPPTGEEYIPLVSQPPVPGADQLPLVTEPPPFDATNLATSIIQGTYLQGITGWDGARQGDLQGARSNQMRRDGYNDDQIRRVRDEINRRFPSSTVPPLLGTSDIGDIGRGTDVFGGQPLPGEAGYGGRSERDVGTDLGMTLTEESIEDIAGVPAVPGTPRLTQPQAEAIVAQVLPDLFIMLRGGRLNIEAVMNQAMNSFNNVGIDLTPESQKKLEEAFQDYNRRFNSMPMVNRSNIQRRLDDEIGLTLGRIISEDMKWSDARLKIVKPRKKEDIISDEDLKILSKVPLKRSFG